MRTDVISVDYSETENLQSGLYAVDDGVLIAFPELQFLVLTYTEITAQQT